MIFVWEPNDWQCRSERPSRISSRSRRNALYSAYDVEGRRLRLGVDSSSKIERAPSRPPTTAADREELRAIFVTYLEALGKAAT